jgi:ADP-ribosyl-[dinitrogen reductase] hydrolase
MKFDNKKDSAIGCLIGLAVGDAYGTTYEFTRKKNMPKETELPDGLLGGGVFNLNPGDWTDDTSMALCLADSIIQKEGFDCYDQMDKYVDWWKNGYNSVNGRCFDIGTSTSSALNFYLITNRKGFISNKSAAGNGVLMRLAPLAMFANRKNCELILKLCAIESKITHPSSQSIECTMILGAILNKIINGERDKRKILNFENLLNESEKIIYDFIFSENQCVKNDKIENIKNVWYDGIGSDRISGDGYCVTTLEAALWAFLSTEDFESGLKRVVSLGDDSDTTGAVYGQIAGAYYGYESIKWKNKVTWSNTILEKAEKLYELNKKYHEAIVTY